MLKKNNTQRLLEILFMYPTKEFHIRSMARRIKVSAPTVMNCIKKLKREGLVMVRKGKVVTVIKANMHNISFIRKKQVHNLSLIYDSKIVDYLNKLYNNPKAIVLFGSYSRGEDIEKSDVDIAILTKKHVKTDLSKYEKMLVRKINLHEIDLNKISKEFRNNLINGIVLKGAL